MHDASVRASSDQVDIVIVGGGLCGSLAAAACGREGYSTVLIDRFEVYPPDFRAEHLDGPMVEQMRRLGFLSGLTDGLPRCETVSVARHGRMLTTMPSVNFGLRYEDLVSRARAMVPSSVRRVTGRATEAVTGPSTQTVRLADGRSVSGRLLVIATGHGQALARQAGIERNMLSAGHSLTFGFDIEPAGGSLFQAGFIVYQRESVRDRIDYLSAFTLGRTTRVNLFTYRDYKDPWTRAFIDDPTNGLHAVLPRLESAIGPYRATGPVSARPMDLYVARDYRKDGVVLIGDVFQASCPATGMGIVRLLTDIERLVTAHLPDWMRTPGMGAAKLASFYDDPVKRACDEKALHDSEYRRAVSTELGLGWRLHRARVAVQEQARGWFHRPVAPIVPKVPGVPPTGSLAPG